MAFEGDLNASAVGETYDVPLKAIANAFYTVHEDSYDFLVIFSGFDFEMPETDKTAGFYHGVRNDVTGIGLQHKIEKEYKFLFEGEILPAPAD